MDAETRANISIKLGRVTNSLEQSGIVSKRLILHRNSDALVNEEIRFWCDSESLRGVSLEYLNAQFSKSRSLVF